MKGKEFETIIPAASGWSATIDGTQNGQTVKMNFLIAAFGVVDGEDGRRQLTPICFNSSCEGVSLAEIAAGMEQTGIVVKGTYLYHNGKRAVEKGRT